MVSRKKNEDEKLSQRMARLEKIIVFSLLNEDNYISPQFRSIILRYLHDIKEESNDYYDIDIYNILAEEVLHLRGQRLKRIEKIQRQQDALREELQKDFTGLSGRLNEVVQTVGSLEKDQKTLSANTHAWLAAQSLGIDTSEIRLSRFVPLRVYLSDTPGSAVEDTSRAINDLLEAYGFEVTDDFPPIHGSWFKRWFAKSKDVLTQPEVAERLQKVERAVELKGLDIPQAEIDAKKADAVSKLMDSVKDVPNAAIQVGSILLIKINTPAGPSIQVRTLTQAELILLENNQKLLASPENIMERLSEICQARNQDSSSRMSAENTGIVKQTAPATNKGNAAYLEYVNGSQQHSETRNGGDETEVSNVRNLTNGMTIGQLPPPSDNRGDIR
ncbi:hypothetical protein AmDm5_2501 [Acetobacter malorum]|uniref:Uncharacterized protein n=1 Tax=Acetobacter malorum TaxID=178901 RepID=A0A087PM96_9PROT|nr:hypothetical protein [Acetobacter malorum]KFL88499.1 hypothetical protein AmDm5_2501 [Acetobacter malorum]OAG76638.1 hypothetical protein Amal_02412 [Acetobacter malorum]